MTISIGGVPLFSSAIKDVNIPKDTFNSSTDFNSDTFTNKLLSLAYPNNIRLYRSNVTFFPLYYYYYTSLLKSSVVVLDDITNTKRILVKSDLKPLDNNINFLSTYIYLPSTFFNLTNTVHKSVPQTVLYNGHNYELVTYWKLALRENGFIMKGYVPEGASDSFKDGTFYIYTVMTPENQDLATIKGIMHSVNSFSYSEGFHVVGSVQQGDVL